MPTRKPKRTNWKQRASELLAERDEALQACTGLLKEKTALFDKLKSAERHNAELLKEREAPRPCDLCGLDTGGPAVEVRSYCDECWKKQHQSSWLRRNWVELTVMATVLGAIAFVVWRAWH